MSPIVPIVDRGEIVDVPNRADRESWMSPIVIVPSA
jgi:hypothetical protein